MKLVTAEQMRRIDREAIDGRGIPAVDLMEAAGRAVAIDVADQFEPEPVVFLCGKGNNGGDGFVAARHLAQAGWPTTVLYLEEPTEGPTKACWDRLPSAVRRVAFADVRDLTGFLIDFDVAVDALLGTGSKGTIRSPYREIVDALNQARLPVVAVDIPSGLDPDTGVGDTVVLAFRTVTIGLPKVGMVRGRGVACCGTVRVEPIGFPADLLANAQTPFRTLTAGEARLLLPARPFNGHKGTYGTALVVAGAPHMPGAAVLTGLGALRGGCGLVRLYVPEPVRSIVAMHLPEALLTDLPGGASELADLSQDQLAHLTKNVDALAVGPGIGEGPGATALLRSLLAGASLPMVIDASALNIIAADEELRASLPPNAVLTPHPGEMARLLRIDTKAVETDRWEVVARAAREFGCTVLLKGAGTVIGEADGSVSHVPTGNSAWSRGGAGDLLTGLIVSLLAQGRKPADAAILGAFVHGVAADIYVRDRSPRGALIRDVAECLPAAWKEIEGAR